MSGRTRRGTPARASLDVDTTTKQHDDTHHTEELVLSLLYPEPDRGLRCDKCGALGEPTTCGGRAARACWTHGVWFERELVSQ